MLVVTYYLPFHCITGLLNFPLSSLLLLFIYFANNVSIFHSLCLLFFFSKRCIECEVDLCSVCMHIRATPLAHSISHAMKFMDKSKHEGITCNLCRTTNFYGVRWRYVMGGGEGGRGSWISLPK